MILSRTGNYVLLQHISPLRWYIDLVFVAFSTEWISWFVNSFIKIVSKHLCFFFLCGLSSIRIQNELLYLIYSGRKIEFFV